MSKSQPQSIEQNKQSQSLSFKPINVFCCPRFYKGLIVADGRSPLSKYLPEITANNCTKILQDNPPQKNQIANFTSDDGLLYYMSKLSKKVLVSSASSNASYSTNEKSNYPIKLMICICLFNQSRNALQTSLQGIYDNLDDLRAHNITQNNIAIIVIQDGILKLVRNLQTRKYQKGKNSIIGFYRQLDKRDGYQKCFLQQRINILIDQLDNFSRKRMQDLVKNNNNFPPSLQKNIAYVYQNLWSPQQNNNIKIKLLSCFKHINGMKLSSHLWFFQGFCRQFNPQICILLDVGTKPQKNSIMKYIDALRDKNVGGVTGFMSVDSNFISQEGQDQNNGIQKKSNNCFSIIGNCLKNTFFSVEKAQQFQYIISHFIDKNFESSLGFLHVLPGAWSAYRYQALIHGQKYQQNLLERKYFKMILDPSNQERDYRQANMYLAQDRILSLGIYCQKGRKFYLKYIPDAIAYTDPMKSHEQLMIQRRRWINSSYFAFMYVFRNYYYNVLESKHNFLRKYLALIFNMILALISFLNGYLTPAFYCFTLYTTIIQSGSHYIIQYAAEVLTLIYIFMVIICVAWSLFGIQWTKNAHIISYIFSFYTFILIGLVIWNILFVYFQISTLNSFMELFHDPQGLMVFFIICINIGGYILIAIIHLPTHCKFVCKLSLDAISYLSYQGAYSHVMLIYAFCNVDNVSWGTKGSKGMRQKRYLNQKISFISTWLLSNTIIAFIFIYVDFFMPRTTKKGIMLMGLGIYASLILFIRIFLALWNQIKWILGTCCRGYKQPKNQQLERYWQQCFRDYKQKLIYNQKMY